MKDYLRRHRTELLVTALVLLFFVILLAPRIFIVIGSGEAGVIYRPLFGGTVVDRVYGEGLWLLFPWNRMYIYNVRIQETKRTLVVLTRDGLNVTLDLSIRYRPDASMVGVLHSTIGPGYVEKVVVPEVFAVVRRELGNRTAEELYTGKNTPNLAIDSINRAANLIGPLPMTAAAPGAVGVASAATALPVLASPAPIGVADVQAPGGALVPPIGASEAAQDPETDMALADIISKAAEKISRKYVRVDAVVLMRARLPAQIEKSIQDKIEHHQQAEAQLFRIQSAQREVMMRQFEAQANVILAGSITPDLLRWRGIEATKELAKSPNAKLVVVGNGTGNVPILLGAGTGTP
ncbi:MAG TPA: SPFH domain-containing protein [Thermoanaerobaculia bacterium]|jgi:regulator of protease activity HflC (stomatin/prohibitin superfamily)